MPRKLKPRIDIGTSDRTLFKRCRRRWDWSSLSRQGLQPKEDENLNLFVGSGVHFALEDFHGYNSYDSPIAAFQAFVNAHSSDELPQDWSDDSFELCVNMLQHYQDSWYPRYFEKRFKQVYRNRKPMVEVRFRIPLSVIPGVTKKHRVGKLDYTGTFDRIVQDEYDRYWVIDYKTAGRFDSSRTVNDPQITAYTWAAEKLFGLKFEGVIWVQMIKDYPNPPRRLKDGTLSKAKDQRVTFTDYQRAVKAEFPTGNIPEAYRELLEHFASTETEFGDRFIRFDMVYRNEHNLLSEEQKFVAEARDMTDLKLKLYPNPTRDCSWDCPFRSPCIAMDDGADYQFILNENYRQAKTKEERDTWRGRLTYPHTPVELQI